MAEYSDYNISSEPSKKKTKVNNSGHYATTEDIFETFWIKFEERDFLKTVIKNVCCERCHALAVLRIKTCDACAGVQFQRASCITERHTSELYPFGVVFLRGYEILRSFIKNETIPKERYLRQMLENLLSYICDKEAQKSVVEHVLNPKEPAIVGTETRLAEVLAEHYFSKLSSSPSYTLDQNMIGKDVTCPCGCKRKINNHFGNTGLGHPLCWHGNLDILLGSNDLCVKLQYDTTQPPEEPLSPGGRTAAEVKEYYSPSIEDLPTKSQTLAQTIVFSFFQKHKHQEFNHALIPCIGVSRKEVIFYLYDSDHDILLQSKSMPLVTCDRDICFETVIAMWLVLNYQHLGSGLSDRLLEAPKSGFFRHVTDNIHLYEKELSLGSSVGSVPVLPFEPSYSGSKAKFVWPSEVVPNDL